MLQVGLLDLEHVVLVDALDHAKMDEGQDVHGSFVHDGLDQESEINNQLTTSLALSKTTKLSKLTRKLS